MITRETIEDMERQLERAGVEMSDFLAEAGVAQTTWWRWGHGKFQPRMDKWQDVQRTHRKMVSSEGAA